MKRGFTLMEVNLAMFIMAVGTLGLVSLYTFGYRENQQSIEDVQAAAIAEQNLNAMVAALSSTNVTWDAWKKICEGKVFPQNGWGYYIGDENDDTDNVDLNAAPFNPSKDPNGTAKDAFKKIKDNTNSSIEFYGPNDFSIGIVITPSNDGRVYNIAVRCGRRAATLIYQPLYYSAVSFQGLVEE